MHRRIVTLLLVCGVAVAAAPAIALANEDADKAFNEGNKLLAKADFMGALHAYKRAAEADKENVKYQQITRVVRQVIRLRGMLQDEKDQKRWFQLAMPLRSFYYQHELYGEAWPIDRKIHQEGLLDDSADRLAETLLALAKNEKALLLLKTVDEKKATPRTTALKALAFARLGQMDEAKKLAATLKIEKDSGVFYCIDVAKVRALLGDAKGMGEALTRACESIPPSRLDGVKTRMKAYPDFAKLVDSEAFVAAMKTKSKMPESSCSGGSSCGKCPNRNKAGGCSSSKGGDKEKSCGGKDDTHKH